MVKLNDILTKLKKDNQPAQVDLLKTLKGITSHRSFEKTIATLEEYVSRGAIIERGMQYLDFTYEDLMRLKELAAKDSDFNLEDKVAKVVKDVDAHRGDNEKQLKLFD